MDRRIEYQPKGGDTSRLESKGRYGMVRMWVAGKTVSLTGYTRAISAKHNKVPYKFTFFTFTLICHTYQFRLIIEKD